jgi:hypothetical protein
VRRIALVLVAAAVGLTLFPVSSPAGIATDDVYRSELVVRDRDGRPHEIDIVVDDRPSGTLLTFTLKRRCGSCRAEVYAKTLRGDEFTVHSPPLGTPLLECQCLVASVDTKFGGRPFNIGWIWDPEQGGAPSGDGYRWAAVTANNLLNVGCFGSGTYTATPSDLLTGEAAPKPKGAEEFPKEMPARFKAKWPRMPACYSESP